MKLGSVPRAVLVAVFAVVVVGALALADTVYVKARNARALDKPDAYEGQVVKRLVYRDKVERKQKGGEWDTVEVDGKTAYVRSRDLDTRQPEDVNEQGKGWGWAKDSSDPTFTAGARGLGPLGQEYSKQNNIEAGRKVVEEKMDKMKLDAARLEAFQKAGSVGEFAGKGARK